MKPIQNGMNKHLTFFKEKYYNSTLLEMYFTIGFVQAVQISELSVHSLQLLAHC